MEKNESLVSREDRIRPHPMITHGAAVSVIVAGALGKRQHIIITANAWSWFADSGIDSTDSLRARGRLPRKRLGILIVRESWTPIPRSG
jgi:hypothetical protein